MFGIMTKKDKRIKELEDQIAYMYYKQPKIIQTSGNVITIGGKAIIEHDDYFHTPIEHYKKSIAQQMLRQIEDEIYFDIKDINGKAVLTGYLRVVAKNY